MTDDFTFPPKEVVLRICIALRNLSSSAGFNLLTLGPMVSTITTRPLRATCLYLTLSFLLILFVRLF
jgi:hypothetical protein